MDDAASCLCTPCKTLPQILPPNRNAGERHTCSGNHNLRPVRVRLLHRAGVLLQAIWSPRIEHSLDQHLRRDMTQPDMSAVTTAAEQDGPWAHVWGGHGRATIPQMQLKRQQRRRGTCSLTQHVVLHRHCRQSCQAGRRRLEPLSTCPHMTICSVVCPPCIARASNGGTRLMSSAHERRARKRCSGSPAWWRRRRGNCHGCSTSASPPAAPRR